MEWLAGLNERDIEEIAAGLESCRIFFPVSAIGLQRVLPAQQIQAVAKGLNALADQGFQESQAAMLLRVLVKDRVSRPKIQDLVDIVTSGPEVAEISNRDTGVVVREMFTHAKKSVLVAGYAVHQGKRVFQTLADRMEADPHLKVRLFLDIQRGKDTSLPSELVLRFAAKFRNEDWPRGKPLPEVFYDPRSLAQWDKRKRACLHAKVVVVDDERVFISSANFTEAAQERNIEIGLLVNSPLIASQVRRFFEVLVNTQQVEKAVAGR